MNCLQEGLVPPSWRTVKARLAEFDLRTQALHRHDQRTVAATKAVPSEYHASHAPEIAQIDHTKVDVVVVDEETREPIGRPRASLMDSPSREACRRDRNTT